MTKQRRVAARGIIFRDGKLLVAKHKEDDGTEAPHWGTFGGGVDPEESLHDAIYREMIEETGIAPKVGRLLFIQQYTGAEMEHLQFFFHIENAADYEAIDLTATTHGIDELSRIEFVDPKTSFIKPSFLQEIDIETHIDGTQPVYLHDELGQPFYSAKEQEAYGV